MFGVLLVAEVLQGVGPEKVAHGPKCGGLFEAVELKHNDDDMSTTDYTEQNISKYRWGTYLSNIF